MSIEKLPSGKYRAVVQFKGQKASSPAVETRAQAKTLEAQLHLKLGAKPKEGVRTVGEMVAGYLADGAGRLSPATLKSYREGAGAIPEAFNARDVSDVSVQVLEGLYGQLRRDKVTEHKIAKVHKVLSASFTKAAKYGWIISNPCRDADKPKPTTKTVNPPSPEQVQSIVAKSVDVNEDLAVCLRLVSATGMRRAEALGLQWSDFDFTAHTVHIRRSLVQDGRDVIETGTKTGIKGQRKISVDQVTMTEMKALQLRQAITATEQEFPTPMWCFSHESGTIPWKPEYITRAMGRLSKEFTLHDFRHFHATQLLAKGIPVVNVSRRLGHSSVTLTLNTYAHWMPQQDRDAADLIGELLDAVVFDSLDEGKTEAPLS